MSFFTDIQSKNTNLVPVVIIGNWDLYGGLDSDAICLSTNSQTLGISISASYQSIQDYYFPSDTQDGTPYWGADDAPAFEERYFKPLLLSIPSLKESIDFQTRKYKISSMNISISNYIYEGKRFSELVGDSLTNKECRVYWVSPTGNRIVHNEIVSSQEVFWDWSYYIASGPENAYTITHAHLAYQGTVRKYEHGVDNATIVVEDISQSKLHKDLPLQDSYLGVTDDVPDKYQNKPIPMVYGSVERSPCVVSNYVPEDDDVGDGQLSYIVKWDSRASQALIDNDYKIPTVGDNFPDGFLFIKQGESTYRVSYSSFFSDYSQPQLDNINISEDNTEITINSIYNAGVPKNAPADNLLEIEAERIPVSATGLLVDFSNDGDNGPTFENNDECDLDLIHLPYSEAYDMDQDTKVEVDKYIVGRTYSPSDWTGMAILFKLNLTGIEEVETKTYFIGAFRFAAFSTATDCHLQVGDFDDQAAIGAYTYLCSGRNKRFAYDNFHSTPLNPAAPTQWEADNPMEILGASEGLTDFYQTPIDSWSSADMGENIKILTLGGNFAGDDEQAYDIHNVALYQRCLVEKPMLLDYFVNVQGRISPAPSAILIIKDILENELGLDPAIISYQSSDEINNWVYSFTVDKNINSKKLLENISSVSPYIPRFNNRGKFVFDSIKSLYQQTDIDKIKALNHIKSEDAISFSFSKTRIEEVYTKVDFKYNWDYAKEDFNGNYVINIEGLDAANQLVNYDRGYYAFPKNVNGDYGAYPDYDPDVDSTLVIEDDRGKYIRDDTTAEAYAKWMLMWYCNQHLKIKVKLPLTYLKYSVGSLVSFDEHLGGVSPYGINYKYGTTFLDEDYTTLGWNVNYSQAHAFFMIISTNKGIDHVELECIQIHHLIDGVYSRDGAVYGCTDPASWTYNADATVLQEGSCLGISDFMATAIYGENNDCPYYLYPDNEFGSEIGTEEYDYAQDYNEEIDIVNENVFLYDAEEVDHPDGSGDRIHPAYAWWINNGSNPDPYAENQPRVVQYSDCYWTDTHYHKIGTVTLFMYGRDEDGVDFELGSLNLDPDTTDDGLIGIPLNENMKRYYLQHGELKIKLRFGIYGTGHGQSATHGGSGYSEFELLQGYSLDVDGNIVDYNVEDDASTGGDWLQQNFDVPSTWEEEINLDGLNFDDIWVEEFTGDLYEKWVFINFSLVANGFKEIDREATYEEMIVDQNQYTENYSKNSAFRLKFYWELPGEPDWGDVNGDGSHNVLDVVALANCVLADNCDDLINSANADVNNDGSYNVLDVVALANCVLQDSCEEDLPHGPPEPEIEWENVPLPGGGTFDNHPVEDGWQFHNESASPPTALYQSNRIKLMSVTGQQGGSLYKSGLLEQGYRYRLTYDVPTIVPGWENGTIKVRPFSGGDVYAILENGSGSGKVVEWDMPEEPSDEYMKLKFEYGTDTGMWLDNLILQRKLL